MAEANRTNDPIRLFKNPFLEALTHFTPTGVILLWGSVVVVSLAIALMVQTIPAKQVAIAWLGGVLLWTLLEYLLHRFLLHADFKSKAMQHFQYMGHGIHHDQPMMRTRLVMPPLGAIPTAGTILLLLWITLTLLDSSMWTAAIYSGIISGYITYDMLHFAYHFSQSRNKVFMALRKHHMRHHGIDKKARYGVSSPSGITSSEHSRKQKLHQQRNSTRRVPVCVRGFADARDVRSFSKPRRHKNTTSPLKRGMFLSTIPCTALVSPTVLMHFRSVAEGTLDRADHFVVLGLVPTVKPRYDLAVPVEQELVEVPRDLAGKR